MEDREPTIETRDSGLGVRDTGHGNRESKIQNRPSPIDNPKSFQVLGVRVDAVQIPEAVRLLDQWASCRTTSHFVAVTGMHGISEAQRDPTLRRILNAADLVVADGMPLVWLGRWHGYALRRRVYGPELMETFCRATGPRYRHFLYGGGPGVADRLAAVLEQRYQVRTVGSYSPPFRPLTEDEQAEVDRRVRAAAPDVVWVGLSTPKQERWMYEHRARLKVPVMVGVGAAFDFIAGTVRQAPAWMREIGLEWSFRLASEPRRLWRRYLVNGPGFVWNASMELLGVKRFE
jgi:N-acetylglucosaminyldiphosphoundecaprenol N-acetyl-beta-D-mannosaminyltransferase